MARIGEGQAFTNNDFKKAIYAIRGSNRQTKGMACAVNIEVQSEGTVLLVTDTWKGPLPRECQLHRYASKKKHFEDYQLKPSSIRQRGHFSLVLCDCVHEQRKAFEKRLDIKCLSGQQRERDFRVYTIYRDECIDLELKYSNGSYNLDDKDLNDLTLRGSPIIVDDECQKYLVGVLTTDDAGNAIPRFLSEGVLGQPNESAVNTADHTISLSPKNKQPSQTNKAHKSVNTVNFNAASLTQDKNEAGHDTVDAQNKRSFNVTKIPIVVYREVCNRLNPRRPNFDDFRMLAEKVGLERKVTENIDQRYTNPTDEILKWWSTKGEATVGKLIELLEEDDFGRMDVVEVLEDWVNGGSS